MKYKKTYCSQTINGHLIKEIKTIEIIIMHDWIRGLTLMIAEIILSTLQIVL